MPVVASDGATSVRVPSHSPVSLVSEWHVLVAVVFAGIATGKLTEVTAASPANEVPALEHCVDSAAFFRAPYRDGATPLDLLKRDRLRLAIVQTAAREHLVARVWNHAFAADESVAGGSALLAVVFCSALAATTWTTAAFRFGGLLGRGANTVAFLAPLLRTSALEDQSGSRVLLGWANWRGAILELELHADWIEAFVVIRRARTYWREFDARDGGWRLWADRGNIQQCLFGLGFEGVVTVCQFSHLVIYGSFNAVDGIGQISRNLVDFAVNL